MVQLENWFYKYNAWSFTKHRLWEECKRAYYYRYIGAALRYSPDFNIQQVKQLKKLDKRFALQGALIHQVLDDQLKQHYLGLSLDEQVARNRYIELVEQSRHNAQNQLVEYYNGAPVNQAFFDRVRENGLDQISLFFGVIWPQLGGLKYLRHEQFDRVKIGEIEGIVKVDYVSQTQEGTIVISDWKTGADDEEYENDLQIGTYVLWATQFYAVPSAKIKSELIYLTTSARRTHEFPNEQLQNIEQLIVSDFEAMNRTYEINYFEPVPEPAKCLSCPFAQICRYSMAGTQR
ncbi:MAG: hypothetical protein BroJett011_07470 [Chloroflexota bacterium]|nr:MAG: hypothetical protein BroJett011_07470 [Chloroflexota bacterium]